MSRISKLSQEKKKDLTDLLLSGITVKETAALTETTLGRVNAIRAKLVDAGILARKRRSRTKSRKTTAPAMNLSEMRAATDRITETVKQARSSVSVKKTVAQAPDLSPVLGTEGFVFRINELEVNILQAKKVHIKRGLVEITF
jgi:hypothetical protein